MTKPTFPAAADPVSRRSPRFAWWSATAGLVALLALAGAVALRPAARSGPPDSRPAARDHRSPVDGRYQHAMRTGLSGDLTRARDEFVRLARSEPGSSTGAWALYQAGLAAKASGDTAGSQAHFDELRRIYPRHSLSLRLAPDPRTPPARAARKRADCGPRSLLALCRQAGITATLPELVRRCKTTKDGTTLEDLGEAARQKGFQVAALQVDGWFLRRHRPTGIGWAEGDHYIGFRPGRGPDELIVTDPSLSGEQTISPHELARRASGVVLLVAPLGRSLPPVQARAG